MSAPATFDLWSPATDTLAWEEMQERQLVALRETFDRLRRHEVWRRRLGSTGSPTSMAELADVAYTTKSDLRAAQEETTSERPLGAFQLVDTEQLRQITTSSGTTGAPVMFGLTTRDAQSWRSAIANAYRTAGVGPGETVALTTGMAIVAGGLPYADGIREAGGALAWIGGQTSSRMAGGMARTRATVLVATASFAAHFAQRCAVELGRDASELAVRTVIAGGEPGAGVPHIRRAILDAWGAQRVSELMGLGDVLPAMWAECHVGNGMHFTAAPDILVELVEPDSGRPVPWEPGATGEAIYTTVSRESCAVVRFRSRDQLAVIARECACGRTSPTVRCVGRTDDMLIYKAMNVYPTAIRDVVLKVAGSHLTGNMRVRKDSEGQVRFDDPLPLEVELAGPADDVRTGAALAAAEEAVRQQLRVRVSIEPQPGGVLPVSDYKNSLTYVRT
ncbi:AMP-binding protein [Microbacterium sediminicola]|uniref:AMP-binding protein n=1 Tax=Microbacterium sediminicola TaxID=415210 RepID=A0ABN2I0Q5_9MICO